MNKELETLKSINEEDFNFYNKVYDILVNLGGASENDRFSFLHSHIYNSNDMDHKKYGICLEWRFGGYFDFGGKYRSGNNVITYYPENHTEELNQLQNKINELLAKIEK